MRRRHSAQLLHSSIVAAVFCCFVVFSFMLLPLHFLFCFCYCLLPACLLVLVLFYVKVETFPASFNAVWLLFGGSDPASFGACFVDVFLLRA
jgi:hypothetical protein